MILLFRLIALVTLVALVPFAAVADEGFYPIRADDGSIIANHRVPAELESRIEKLPGVVVVGNPRGIITLNEFYDLNCPYCRRAFADVDSLLKSHKELRLVLVPFPVLGIPSIQASRVELAVREIAPPQKFYEFIRRVYSSRGVIDGNRALAAAKATGLDVTEVLKIANQDSLADTMIAHVKLGDALAIQATPGYVIKGVAIVGHPGRKALARIIESVKRCDAVVCEDAPR
jgi:protein-disulfide isomerase